ncbi:hypothetical protein TNCT_98701 [Trichonephila clavata]|uniref:Uncharacterized protein n=1 Tax=Trichonephila clavata TaxID=2740835 RepID=A0A8X6LSQ6_TRICU|nr:hypothetical protein TNCT_98701 [Trichonephila clavata]
MPQGGGEKEKIECKSKTITEDFGDLVPAFGRIISESSGMCVLFRILRQGFVSRLEIRAFELIKKKNVIKDSSFEACFKCSRRHYRIVFGKA